MFKLFFVIEVFNLAVNSNNKYETIKNIEKLYLFIHRSSLTAFIINFLSQVVLNVTILLVKYFDLNKNQKIEKGHKKTTYIP